MDGQGNVYIGDSGNHRVRQVSRGTIITVAGTGTPGDSGEGGNADDIRLNFPSGVAVDRQGNVYIASTANHRVHILPVEPGGTVRGTLLGVAGNGTPGSDDGGGFALRAQLNLPRGVAVDGQRNVYIADTLNHRVVKVDQVSGHRLFTTVAGSGTPGSSGDGGPATRRG